MRIRVMRARAFACTSTTRVYVYHASVCECTVRCSDTWNPFRPSSPRKLRKGLACSANWRVETVIGGMYSWRLLTPRRNSALDKKQFWYQETCSKIKYKYLDKERLTKNPNDAPFYWDFHMSVIHGLSANRKTWGRTF